MKRINDAESICHLQLISQAFSELEVALELQNVHVRRLSQSRKATATQIKLEAALVRPPVPWRDSDPPLVVGREGAFFGYSTLHPSVLTNCIVLGGTGSGKSRSVVMPLLAALLNYRLKCGKTAAVLVIDPKRELEEKVRYTLAARGESDRLVVIGECAPVRLFAADCPLSASDRLVKLTTFAPSDTPNGDHSYWKNLGMAVVQDFVQLETEFARQTNGGRLMARLANELGLPLPMVGDFGRNCETCSRLHALVARIFRNVTANCAGCANWPA